MLRPLVIAVAALFVSPACTPLSAPEASSPSRSLQERFNSLSDAMRTIPNVQVNGDVVRYRGVNSLTGDDQIRVAAQGRIVGSVVQAERLYPLDEITHLRLIRPAEAQQRYGMLGANGVVELTLRDN